MSISKRNNEGTPSLMGALGAVLDQPTAPQPATFLEQVKTSYLLHQLYRKLGPSEATQMDLSKSMSDSPFSYGLYLDSPYPARLYLNQRFSLVFHVIDRSGSPTPALNSQSFSIALLTPLRVTHRKGIRSVEKILAGATTVEGSSDKGIAFRLRFRMPSSLIADSNPTLQVKCCTDQRIKPLELPEIQVLSQRYKKSLCE